MKSLAIIGGVVLSILLTVFAITCTGKDPQTNLAATGVSPMPGASESLPSSATSGNLPLRTLRDVPLSGGATRFDYQSFDPDNGRLYIAHLGDGVLSVFYANQETVIGDVNLSLIHISEPTRLLSISYA